MTNLKKAQVSTYSLADLNMGHCVELTFFEGKSARFLMLALVKLKLFKHIAF